MQEHLILICGLSILRPAREDLKAVYRVFEVTIPDTMSKEGIELSYAAAAWEIEHKKRLLDRSFEAPDMIFLIAKIEELIIGTISFGPCGEDIHKCTKGSFSNIGEMGSLYILPKYQGHGVGSALIGQMASELNRRGVERFCLDSGYRHAQEKWLRKFGETYMTLKDYWGQGYDHMIWLCEVRDYL